MSDEKMREEFEKYADAELSMGQEYIFGECIWEKAWQAATAKSSERIKELEQQLASLVNSVESGLRTFKIPQTAQILEALDNPTQTAESYKRKVQAEALEEAAEVFNTIGYSKFKTPAEELLRMASELKGE